VAYKYVPSSKTQKGSSTAESIRTVVFQKNAYIIRVWSCLIHYFLQVRSIFGNKNNQIISLINFFTGIANSILIFIIENLHSLRNEMPDIAFGVYCKCPDTFR